MCGRDDFGRSWSVGKSSKETLKPGASVASIARAQDVNANQVFKWRKQYQQGRLDDDKSPHWRDINRKE